MAYILDFDITNAPLLTFEWEDKPVNPFYFGLTAKVPVDVTRLPTTAILKEHRNKNKNGPDHFPDIMHVQGWAGVSRRFKDLVERFEPGVHLFHPITLKRPDGTLIEPNYYIFSANQHADFVLTKMLKITWAYGALDRDVWPEEIRDIELPVPNNPNWTYKANGADSIKSPPSFSIANHLYGGKKLLSKRPIYISKQEVKGWHLYTDWRSKLQALFVSDEFYQAFKQENLKYLEVLTYANEVDEPWDEEENFGPALDWLRTHEAEEWAKQEWARLPNNGRGEK